MGFIHPNPIKKFTSTEEIFRWIKIEHRCFVVLFFFTVRIVNLNCEIAVCETPEQHRVDQMTAVLHCILCSTCAFTGRTAGVFRGNSREVCRVCEGCGHQIALEFVSVAFPCESGDLQLQTIHFSTQACVFVFQVIQSRLHF